MPKTTAVKKKKKKKSKSRPTDVKGPANGVFELDGYQLDQKVWCILSTGKAGYGRIIFFHPLNKEGPAITVWDEVSTAYRVGLMADIFEKSKGASKSKLISTKAKK